MKLDPYQRDFIKMLAKAKVGGQSEREVIWFLMQMAITHLTETGYVQKFLEARRLLRTPDDRATPTKEKP